MSKYLQFIITIFLILSCQKIANDKTIAKNNSLNIKPDSIFINEKSVVFISATHESIEKEKKKMGEDNFYIMADDGNYYSYEAHQFLKNKKLKTYEINHNNVIVFKSKKGNFTVLRDTIEGLGSTYLFEPNQLPKKIFNIDIENEYEKYYNKK